MHYHYTKSHYTNVTTLRDLPDETASILSPRELDDTLAFKAIFSTQFSRYGVEKINSQPTESLDLKKETLTLRQDALKTKLKTIVNHLIFGYH